MVHVLALIPAERKGIEGVRADEATVMPVLTDHGGVLLSRSRRAARKTPSVPMRSI